MKIAIISDIHGNMEALEAVLEDIKTQGCDKIYALGDYAMAGPEPSKVVDWFREKSSEITMIQGNTDSMIANYTDELYQTLKDKAPVMAEALQSDVKTLNQEQKDFLKNLPAQLQIKNILLVHGSPRRNNEDILPDTPMEKLEEIISGVEADIIFCGHTHLPCGFQTPSKKTIVNVGSVGRPFTAEPKTCYLKLTINGEEALFEHRLVEYNKELASKKLAKRNFVGADKLAGMLLNPTIRHF